MLPALQQAHRTALVLILIFFALLSIVYNVTTPLFEGPDEAAHFLYVEHLAGGNGLPGPGSPPGVLWEGIQQPPLYYAVAALLAAPFDTTDLRDVMQPNPHRGGETGGVNLYYHSEREAFPYSGTTLAVHAVRLLNTAFGLITVLATFGAARQIFPRRPVFALGAAAIVAFNPQFLFTGGSISNDGAIAAACAVGIWLCLRIIRRNDLSRRDALVLGLVTGLAALTKPSGLALAVPAAIAVAVTAWRKTSWATLLRGGLAIAVGVVLLAGWWYVRNVQLYGSIFAWDVLATIDPQTIRAESISLSEALSYSSWLQKSFWGVFTNGVLMDYPVYRALEILMRVAGIGLLVWLVRQAVRRTAGAVVWLSLGLLLVWGGVVYVALLRFMQNVDATNQGRLLFPAISALSILLLWGLSGFFPRRWTAVPAGITGAGLLLLSVAVPFLYIVPAYAHPPAGRQLALDEPAAGMPVRFGDGIEMLDYSISPTVVEPGSVIHVTFDWRCVAPMDTSYKLFVHVLGYDGERLTQLDTIPYRGRFATLLWQPGQEFRDEYDLFITGKAQPSLGQLEVGFFPWDDPGERLPVYTEDGRMAGDHLGLAAFKIGPKENRRPEVTHPTEVQFGDAIALVGYGLEPAPAVAGEPLVLTLYWQATAAPVDDYKVFIHLLDAGQEIVAQQDALPQGGNYPTSIWATGEYITDAHALDLPADLPGGEYTVAIGWYRPDTGERLPATITGQPVPDGRAIIGVVEIDAQ